MNPTNSPETSPRSRIGGWVTLAIAAVVWLVVLFTYAVVAARFEALFKDFLGSVDELPALTATLFAVPRPLYAAGAALVILGLILKQALWPDSGRPVLINLAALAVGILLVMLAVFAFFMPMFVITTSLQQG